MVLLEIQIRQRKKHYRDEKFDCHNLHLTLEGPIDHVFKTYHQKCKNT